MASIPAIVEEASDEQKTKLINEAKAMGDSYKLIPQIKAQINTIAPEVKLVCTDCGNGSVGIVGSKCQQCSSTNKLISQEGN